MRCVYQSFVTKPSTQRLGKLELKDSFFERLLYLSFEVVKSFYEKLALKFLSQGISQSREEGMLGG